MDRYITQEESKFILDNSNLINTNKHHAATSSNISEKATAQEILNAIESCSKFYCDIYSHSPEVVRLNDNMCEKLKSLCPYTETNLNNISPHSRIFGIRIERGMSNHIMMCREIDLK